MLKLVLLTMLIIAFAIAFLSVNVLLKKNGRFPNTHVSGSQAMRDRGITCAQSQDFAQRHRYRPVSERSKNVCEKG